MIKRKKAVVAEESGITRDRNYYLTSWNRKSFYLVDTGGLDLRAKEEIPKLVRMQTEVAIKEADFVLLMVDSKVGLQTLELEIARKLLRERKRLILVANKVDKPSPEQEVFEFSRLGIGEPWPVSALNGLGVADLLDHLARQIPDEIPASFPEGIKVAVIGRPNVGKSSFVNSLLGQEKVIVSESPGTTRDSIDTQVEQQGRKFVLVDTAGVRHRSKDVKQVEYYTSLRTFRTIRECDVTALLVEAPQGLVKQDLRIAEQVIEAGKGIILIVNKWDLIDTSTVSADDFADYLSRKASFLNFVPMLFVSAKTGLRISKVLPSISEVYQHRRRRIETSQLNDKLGAEIERRPPAAVKGKYIKIYYITQVDSEPPEFVLFSNYPQLIKDHYLRFIEQKIRAHFGFMGVPLKLRLRKRK
jgi:GTP-binding protein